jgi:hypothetical protein
MSTSSYQFSPGEIPDIKTRFSNIIPHRRILPTDATFGRAFPLALRAALVRTTAAVKSGAIPSADRQDAEQGVLTGVWLALTHYDSALAGLRTFIEVVVCRQITSQVRAYRSRAVRDSLNAPRTASGEGGLRELELQVDNGRAIDGVSSFDQAVALSLIDHSVTETSLRLRVSRATVYRSIERPRAAFTIAGFHNSASRGAGC